MRVEQKLVPISVWYGLIAPLLMVGEGLGRQCGVLTLPNSPCDLLGFWRLQGKDLFLFGRERHSPARKGDAIRLVDHARPRKTIASSISDRRFCRKMAKNSQFRHELTSQRNVLQFYKVASQTHAVNGIYRPFFWTTSNEQGRNRMAKPDDYWAALDHPAAAAREFKHTLETHVAHRSWRHHQASRPEAFSCRSKRRQSKDGIGSHNTRRLFDLSGKRE